jgi:hypothetical protein
MTHFRQIQLLQRSRGLLQSLLTFFRRRRLCTVRLASDRPPANLFRAYILLL